MDTAENSFNPTNIPPRKGKWSKEEEEYADALINAFGASLLPLPYGSTLRFYLSSALHCEPMRISKKFSKGGSIGKVSLLSLFCFNFNSDVIVPFSPPSTPFHSNVTTQQETEQTLPTTRRTKRTCGSSASSETTSFLKSATITQP